MALSFVSSPDKDKQDDDISDSDIIYGDSDSLSSLLSADDQYYAEFGLSLNSENSEADAQHQKSSKATATRDNDNTEDEEEGEIKDNVSYEDETTDGGDVPTRGLSPAPTNKLRPRNSRRCHHYMQGRCIWADNCRFSHDQPPPFHTDDTLFNYSHIYQSKLFHVSRNLPYSMRYRRHPYMVLSPYHFQTLSPRPSYHQPFGGGIIGGEERIEEDRGWHRLRTITTSKWNESDNDNSSDNDTVLKLKLSQAKEVKSLERDDESKRKKSKAKKKKKKERATEMSKFKSGESSKTENRKTKNKL